MAAARISVPKHARRGEVIEIKALVAHPMETGFRRDQFGQPRPRNIIRTFACAYNGVEVFFAELHPAIAANPYLAFSTVATESGTLQFTWRGDNGFELVEAARIEVT